MLFSEWTDLELVEKIRDLEDVLTGGLRSVDYNGKKLEYSAPDAIRRAIAELRLAFSQRGEGAASRRVPRIIYSGSDRGIF